MQQWEYCAITPLDAIRDSNSKAAHLDLTSQSLKVTQVRTAEAIARLGTEGWEIAACGTWGTGHIIYFKRPRPEPHTGQA